MALIKCKKCGSEISSKAKACVHCGKKRTNNNVLIIILVCLFSFIAIILAIIGIVFFFVAGLIEEYDNKEWKNVIEIYGDENYTNYVCTVERTISTEGFNIIYKSHVIDGKCDDAEYKLDGTFSYENGDLRAKFYNNNEYTEANILFEDDYICYNNCNHNENIFYSDINGKEITKKYIEMNNNSTYDDTTPTDFSVFSEISYDNFNALFTSTDKTVVFIGSTGCHYCVDYSKILNQIMQDKGIVIYHLNIDVLNDTERNHVMELVKNEGGGIPVLAFFNNGFKEALVGLQTKDTTINKLNLYELIDNNSL